VQPIGVSFTGVRANRSESCWRAGVRPIGVSFTRVQQKGSPACLRAGVRPIGVSFPRVVALDRESYMLESRSAANRGEFYRGSGNRQGVGHVGEQEGGQ